MLIGTDRRTTQHICHPLPSFRFALCADHSVNSLLLPWFLSAGGRDNMISIFVCLFLGKTHDRGKQDWRIPRVCQEVQSIQANWLNTAYVVSNTDFKSHILYNCYQNNFNFFVLLLCYADIITQYWVLPNSGDFGRVLNPFWWPQSFNQDQLQVTHWVLLCSISLCENPYGANVSIVTSLIWRDCSLFHC